MMNAGFRWMDCGGYVLFLRNSDVAPKIANPSAAGSGTICGRTRFWMLFASGPNETRPATCGAVPLKVSWAIVEVPGGELTVSPQTMPNSLVLKVSGGGPSVLPS